MPARDKSVVRFEIEPRSIWLILATVSGIWLAGRLWVVILILTIALLFAGTFNPLIGWLEKRGVKRNHALGLLFVALSIVAAALLFLTVPPLIQQLTQMVQNAPTTRLRLIALLSAHGFTLPLAHAVQSAELQMTFTAIENHLLHSSAQAMRVIGYGVTALVLSFYLLADGRRVQGMVYAIVPRNYHMRLARIILKLEPIVGGYMRGQLITSTAIGLFTFALLIICKVPNALSLALFAAVVDVIPFIGGLMGIVPAVLSALSRGLPVAGAVLVISLIYMEIESRILVPRIYGKVLRLSPTVVILALISGGTLMGVVGALLALPIAAGLLMMLEELRIEMPGDDSIDPSMRARHAKAEAAYEQMSAGTTAPEAGEIAKSLVIESE